MAGINPALVKKSPTYSIDPQALRSWWDKSLTNNLFVKPITDFVNYTGDVASGTKSPMGLEGVPTNEATDVTTHLASTIPMAGAMTRPVEGVLAANTAGFIDKGPLPQYAIDLAKSGVDNPYKPEHPWYKAYQEKTPQSLEQVPWVHQPAVSNDQSEYLKLISVLKQELPNAGPDELDKTAAYVLENPNTVIADLNKYGVDPVKAHQQYYMLDQPDPEIVNKVKSGSQNTGLPITEFPMPKTDPLALKPLDPPTAWDLTYENGQWKVPSQFADKWEYKGGKIVPKTADPLALKPLDSEKYPWLAKPSTPSQLAGTGILDKFDSSFPAVRAELYRRGMPQDQLLEIQRLARSGSPDDFDRAVEMSAQLKSLLPPDWNYAEGQRFSTVVPHAIDMAREQGRGTSSAIQGGVEQLRNMANKVTPEAAARARDQGYDLNNVLLRGTRYPTDQFLDPKMKEDEAGMFFAPANPYPELGVDIANNYGRYLYPVVTRAQNPLERDFEGKGYGTWMDKFVNEAKAGGHDMAIARNMLDESGSGPRVNQDQYILFDPKLIRSIFAQFDPNRMDENNLLATPPTLGPDFSGFAPQQPLPPPSDPYETKLNPEEELAFQAWKQKYAPQDSGYDYDLRGAFKAGLQPDPNTGHWPDTYKKPNHPTFSNQSRYAPPRRAGHWNGDAFVPP